MGVQAKERMGGYNRSCLFRIRPRLDIKLQAPSIKNLGIVSEFSMGTQTRTDNLPCTFLIPVPRFFMSGTCKSGAVPWADNSLASIVVLAVTLGRESQSPTKGDKRPRLRFTGISPMPF